MCKIAVKLFPGVGYRQVVLTLPEQLRIPFYQHPDRAKLYSKFMQIAHICLEALVHEMFKSTDYKIAPIVFLHTNGRNGSYNPHLHVILAEGALHPKKVEWKAFHHLSMAKLRLLWQKHLLSLITDEFEELAVLVSQLQKDYPNGFYTYPGNKAKDRVPTKSYQGLIRYLTKYLSAPPIGVSKILDYDGTNVKYDYQSHQTKARAYETVSARIFIGRMVQHILPKH